VEKLGRAEWNLLLGSFSLVLALTFIRWNGIIPLNQFLFAYKGERVIVGRSMPEVSVFSLANSNKVPLPNGTDQFIVIACCCPEATIKLFDAAGKNYHKLTYLFLMNPESLLKQVPETQRGDVYYMPISNFPLDVGSQEMPLQIRLGTHQMILDIKQNPAPGETMCDMANDPCGEP
jgi:hypothetical protein